MTLKLVTPPTSEPVTLAQAKTHLRISDTTEDGDQDLELYRLIATARHWAEGFQNKAYCTQTWTLSLDKFPSERFIEIPKEPLQSIIAMIYDNGSTQVISFLDPSGTALFETDDYIVDGNRFYVKSGKSWPYAVSQSGAVQIQFIAGYGDADDVPEEVKSAILLKVSELYENRGDADTVDNTAARSLLYMERDVPI